MAKKNNPEEIRSKIIAKAWKDPAFKKKLTAHPKEALKEMGYNLPEKTNVKIVEDNATSYTFVLPPSPANARGLSDEQLEQAAGGQTVCWPNAPSC